MLTPSDAAVLDLAKPLIKSFEGFRAKPYLCPAGKPTIGWGTTRYPSGKAVTGSDYPLGIPDDFAGVCLISAIVRVWDELRELLTREPTAHQAAAMVCLAYNIGGGAFAKSSVLGEFNADADDLAAQSFLLWDKAHVGGVLTVLPGLTKRREAERAMFLTPDSA